MKTTLQVLTEEEKNRIHEASLRVLARTGLRVDSEQARALLKAAGAEVNDSNRIVNFPRAVVEEALRLAPKKFSLGARRDKWKLEMNAGETVLCMDGQGVSAYDFETKTIRPSTFQDLMNATRLANALDEVGVYWNIVTPTNLEETAGNFVMYARTLLTNFTKHIQEPASTKEEAKLLKEILHIVFGTTEEIKKRHPWSFLLCPQSPLVMEKAYTDAYLAVSGLGIPVGVMPMPLMGATAPASMAGTAVLGNSEVLAMLCLVQAAEPEAPFIYSPALAMMDPRTGGYFSGAVENGIFGAMETEMGRFYDLPVMASGGSTGRFVPTIQSGIERGMNGLLSALSYPDILVGPGLLGGSMVLNLEQFYLDVEMFRMSRKAGFGVTVEENTLLDDIISEVGPGGHFLGEDSTITAIRSNRWLLSDLFYSPGSADKELETPESILDRAKQKVEQILKQHDEFPLPKESEKEFDSLQKKCTETM